MLKKIVSLILSFSLIFTSSSFVFAKEESKNEVDMDIQSKSVVLMDVGTGKVLYEKNKDEKLPLASVTKVMTILLILEAVNNKTINMSDMVTISDYASKMGGSQLFMEEGDTFCTGCSYSSKPYKDRRPIICFRHGFFL